MMLLLLRAIMIMPLLLMFFQVPDVAKSRLYCTVNGEMRQDSNTADMCHDVHKILKFLCERMTLLPGTTTGSSVVKH